MIVAYLTETGSETVLVEMSLSAYSGRLEILTIIRVQRTIGICQGCYAAAS